ncbi:VOC family protein [Streptomyces sp. NPDC048639]|uniref:VOC family protein n=1 Tax=Streptomyces sp. NPDC048639 TaxID=3365581 RepID=UPI00371B8C93
MFLGLRTIMYPAPNLDADKAWWTSVLGIEPYFDEPFYVGFNVGGYEPALDPHASPSDGALTYWGVPDVDQALERLTAAGATVREAVQEVGGSIRAASVVEPSGSVIGLLENPHFALPDSPPRIGDGPGR